MYFYMPSMLIGARKKAVCRISGLLEDGSHDLSAYMGASLHSRCTQIFKSDRLLFYLPELRIPILGRGYNQGSGVYRITSHSDQAFALKAF